MKAVLAGSVHCAHNKRVERTPVTAWRFATHSVAAPAHAQRYAHMRNE